MDLNHKMMLKVKTIARNPVFICLLSISFIGLTRRLQESWYGRYRVLSFLIGVDNVKVLRPLREK